MANEELKISIVARADQAEAEMKSLTKLADELTEDQLEIVVKAKADAAEAEIKRLTKLMEGLSDPVDIKVAAEGITAAKSQIDDLQRLTDKPLEQKVEVTGANTARRDIDDLGNSADKSKSVLANMVGNATQDLGVLGGVAGSAGVAIGQMGEYMADAASGGSNLGTILKNFAGVAAPIAIISVGVGLAAKAFGDAQKRAKEAEEQARKFNEALEETTGLAEAAEEALVGTGDATNVFLEALLKADDEALTNITDAAEVLDRKLTDIGPIMEDLFAPTTRRATIGDLLRDDLGAFEPYRQEIVALIEEEGNFETISNRINYTYGDRVGASKESKDAMVREAQAVRTLIDENDDLDLDQVIKDARQHALTTSDVTRALYDQALATEARNAAEEGRPVNQLNVTKEYLRLLDEDIDKQKTLKRVEDQRAASLDKLQARMEGVAGVMDIATNDAEQFATAIESVGAAHVAANSAHVEAADSIRDVGEAMKEALDAEGIDLEDFTKPFDTATEAFRGVDQAVLESAGSIKGAISGMVAQGITDIPTLESHYQGMVTGLRNVLDQAGLTDEQIDAYLVSVGLVPDLVKTTVELRGAEEAEERLQALLTLAQLLGLPVDAQVRIAILQAQGADTATLTAAVLEELAHFDPIAYYQVRGDVEPFKGDVASAHADVEHAQPVDSKVGGDTDPMADDVEDERDKVKNAPAVDQKVAGDTQPLADDAAAGRSAINTGPHATVKVDADLSPAAEAIRIFQSLRRTITIFTNTIFGGSSGTSSANTNNGSRGNPDTFAVESLAGPEPMLAGVGDNIIPGDTPGSTYGTYVPPTLRARGGDGGGSNLTVVQYLPAGVNPTQVVNALRRAERRNGAVTTRLVVQPTRFGST